MRDRFTNACCTTPIADIAFVTVGRKHKEQNVSRQASRGQRRFEDVAEEEGEASAAVAVPEGEAGEGQFPPTRGRRRRLLLLSMALRVSATRIPAAQLWIRMVRPATIVTVTTMTSHLPQLVRKSRCLACSITTAVRSSSSTARRTMLLHQAARW